MPQAAAKDGSVYRFGEFEADLRAWAEEGLSLAEHSLRSWEALSLIHI